MALRKVPVMLVNVDFLALAKREFCADFCPTSISGSLLGFFPCQKCKKAFADWNAMVMINIHSVAPEEWPLVH